VVSSPDPASVVAHDPEWPALFEAVGGALRRELGDLAARIDHIGSTSVPGLDAKPIIDVQISVESLEPVSAYAPALERAGFLWRSENPELTKRYFREAPGRRRTHVHVRRAGSFSEQLALLFRDYLRADDAWAKRYAAEKHRLAHLLKGDRQAYVDGKDPFVWETIRRADRWAQQVGWQPGPSDA
jgi:GrpB-like predicted nucleotidyltransferase (UPF0157 family)